MNTLHDAVEALPEDLYDLMMAYLKFSGADIDSFERVCKSTELPSDAAEQEPVLILLWATEHVFFKEKVADSLLVFLRSRVASEHVEGDGH